MAEPSKLVPARYIGHHAARLTGRLYFNVDGSRRQSALLESGDTLLMPEREILGFTLLHDPHQVNDPLDLGVGKRVLPEHAGMNPEQLAALGYEWHLGRTDFIPLEVEGSIEPSAPADEIAHESEVQSAPAEAPQDTPSPDPLTVLNSLSKEG